MKLTTMITSAVVITGGNVRLVNLSLTTATDSPTIVVSGGVLTLRNDIVQGETLSGALAKHPGLFTKFFTNLVRAGEASDQRFDCRAVTAVSRVYDAVR